MLLGRLRVTRGSLPLSRRVFSRCEVSRISAEYLSGGTDGPQSGVSADSVRLIRRPRGGSWVLNASPSGAGVSNALPYYLLLIGSAFVELLRLRAAKIPRLYD